ncbi:hypothetical protein KPH14_006437 [Odynerus spinipes]|uniref:Uncharacterized protein n=1 Tax=Odynerus spinipes TaxID=1348599 RepID=A0AAD9RQG4_9HYME|nr:hypothetical protein KPH14_006437 [Odynerus spinipes]
MSQVYPSVSHQLAAASIAFRRARRKFPKDYGARSKGIKIEVGSSGREKNDQQPVSSSSAKCMSNIDNKLHCFCSQSACSDEGSRYLSLKQSSSIKQSKCACHRRNEEFFEETTRWSNDRSALGDVLDKIPTTECFSEKTDPRKSIDPYNHNTERERRKCTCCQTSSRKGVESGPSKLDSVDLLYVAPHEKHDYINSRDDHGDSRISRELLTVLYEGCIQFCPIANAEIQFTIRLTPRSLKHDHRPRF